MQNSPPATQSFIALSAGTSYLVLIASSVLLLWLIPVMGVDIGFSFVNLQLSVLFIALPLLILANIYNLVSLSFSGRHTGTLRYWPATLPHWVNGGIFLASFLAAFFEPHSSSTITIVCGVVTYLIARTLWQYPRDGFSV